MSPNWTLPVLSGCRRISRIIIKSLRRRWQSNLARPQSKSFLLPNNKGNTMSISLESLKRSSPLPPRDLIFGTAGVGKSTLASLMPSPVFLATEDGLSGLEGVAHWEIRSYQSLSLRKQGTALTPSRRCTANTHSRPRSSTR